MTHTPQQDLEAIEQAVTRFARRLVQRPFHEAQMAAAGVAVGGAPSSPLAGVGGGGAGRPDRPACCLLARLWEWGPLRLSDLAHRLGVNASTTSRQVQLLEREGLGGPAAPPHAPRAA